MKKLILLAAVSLLAVTSCKKDDEEMISITGTWKLSKNEVKFGNGTNESQTPNSCEAQTYFDFGNDGKLTSKVYEKVGTTCTSDTYTGTYSYDADKHLLTVTESGYTNTNEVITLTASELVIQTDIDDFDDDGKNDKVYTYFAR